MTTVKYTHKWKTVAEFDETASLFYDGTAENRFTPESDEGDIIDYDLGFDHENFTVGSQKKVWCEDNTIFWKICSGTWGGFRGRLRVKLQKTAQKPTSKKTAQNLPESWKTVAEFDEKSSVLYEATESGHFVPKSYEGNIIDHDLVFDYKNFTSGAQRKVWCEGNKVCWKITSGTWGSFSGRVRVKLQKTAVAQKLTVKCATPSLMQLLSIEGGSAGTIARKIKIHKGYKKSMTVDDELFNEVQTSIKTSVDYKVSKIEASIGTKHAHTLKNNTVIENSEKSTEEVKIVVNLEKEAYIYQMVHDVEITNGSTHRFFSGTYFQTSKPIFFDK